MITALEGLKALIVVKLLTDWWCRVKLIVSMHLIHAVSNLESVTLVACKTNVFIEPTRIESHIYRTSSQVCLHWRMMVDNSIEGLSNLNENIKEQITMKNMKILRIWLICFWKCYVGIPQLMTKIMMQIQYHAQQKDLGPIKSLC